MVSVVVEGKRDVKFFNNYICNYLGYAKDRYQIIKTDGKSILLDKDYRKYSNLKDDIKTSRVKKVLFIIDSDNAKDNPDIGGYENSITKIKELITALELKQYSDYFIACDMKNGKGNIEDLVISTLDDEIGKCIKTFSDCSDLENDDGKRLLGIYNYGYPEKPYDFTHKNFDELKEKLKNLFEEE